MVPKDIDISDLLLVSHLFNAPPTPWWIQLWVQKVKEAEGKKFKAHSLTCSTLRVNGCARAPGWD